MTIDPSTFVLGYPGRAEVVDPATHLAEVVIGVAVLGHPEGHRIDPHRANAGIAEERVGRHGEPLHDVVLEEPMGDDHIRADQLLPTGDLVADDRAVVGDDLEIEPRHEDTGVALAGRRLGDVAKSPAKGEVGPLDRVEELRTVDPVREHVDERGVALQLREAEARPERPDDRRHEVGEDVLRMVEFRAGEVAGIAGDIGDQEARRLGL